MNAQRRKELSKIVERIDELEQDLSALIDEEQECFDNMPENLQYSEKGERTEETISELEIVRDSFQEMTSAINEVIER